ncbi:hypothetical protein [Nonomuraea aridisoli]|uniref:hypothetical protein n=1 Tax=Nonomuraea aridisoli TaxID=2070368 RepID=UPI0011B94955|nr:hypothetical protein [Nonomuraea aridisoli]
MTAAPDPVELLHRRWDEQVGDAAPIPPVTLTRRPPDQDPALKPADAAMEDLCRRLRAIRLSDTPWDFAIGSGTPAKVLTLPGEELHGLVVGSQDVPGVRLLTSYMNLVGDAVVEPVKGARRARPGGAAAQRVRATSSATSSSAARPPTMTSITPVHRRSSGRSA